MQDYQIKFEAIRRLGVVGYSIDGKTNEVTYNSPEDAPSDAELQSKIEEIKSALPISKLRNSRNRRLQETDWTQLGDIPADTKSAWQAYRQALRDITNTYSSLDDVVWPTKPE
jgi:ABC-type phosphonate transport system ATPase subunit